MSKRRAFRTREKLPFLSGAKSSEMRCRLIEMEKEGVGRTVSSMSTTTSSLNNPLFFPLLAPLPPLPENDHRLVVALPTTKTLHSRNLALRLHHSPMPASSTWAAQNQAVPFVNSHRQSPRYSTTSTSPYFLQSSLPCLV